MKSISRSYCTIISKALYLEMCLVKQNRIRFEVIKQEKENSLLISLPGFYSSGDVWNETKSNFEKILLVIHLLSAVVVLRELNHSRMLHFYKLGNRDRQYHKSFHKTGNHHSGS
jgi:hypothetical protein